MVERKKGMPMARHCCQTMQVNVSVFWFCLFYWCDYKRWSRCSFTNHFLPLVSVKLCGHLSCGMWLLLQKKPHIYRWLWQSKIKQIKTCCQRLCLWMWIMVSKINSFIEKKVTREWVFRYTFTPTLYILF